MKVIKRVLLSLLILIVLALIAGVFFVQYLKKAAVPDYNKSFVLYGLQSEVEILRDAHGIPHIYAKSDSDLYRAVGFAMAQDRLWQMDLLRRVTQGRLSEILGKDQAETDLLMRALRIQEKSAKILKNSDPEIVSALQSFADGVNQYMAQFPLPPEFKVLGYQPEWWEPVHSINLIGYMSWDLSMGWGTEYFLHQLRAEVPDSMIAEMIPDLAQHKTSVFEAFGNNRIDAASTLLSATQKLKDLGIEVFNGSNNWAVAGKKSKTGMPLLANDMHLGLFAPGIWYQMHQVVDGKLDVSGVVVPGQPFVIAGHNDRIAWGMTNVMLDDLDFYQEKLNEDSTKYWFDGAWKDLIIQPETIKTKEGDSIQTELKFTHRGPIVNRMKKEKEMPLSIRWLGNEMSNEIRTVYLVNRAKNWDDFRAAMSTFISVSQNVVYADVDGNIGLQCTAGIPVREGSGIEIYPGDSSKYDWKGLVPFDELPFEYNPERGYVSSANNKTVPEGFPHYISHWFATPSRIDRIREMLEEKEKLGVEDFKAMQGDVKSKTAERMTPVFLTSLQKETTWPAAEKAALDKLLLWNFELTRESQAATVFEVLYRKVLENLVKDELSSELFEKIKGERMLLENLLMNVLADRNSAWIDNKNTAEKETLDDCIQQSFVETVQELSGELGANVDEWQWGKLHTFTMNHPLGVVNALNKVLKLNRGPYPVPGSFHTVCPYTYSYRNLYKANNGASERHIFDAGNWDRSETIIPTGTSGIPASGFYLDQTEMYLQNQYHADPFSRAEVEKATKFKMTLNPDESL
ncbi:penicillin acylase family protein [Maribellus luteus]|uniref:Penicillin acylase family protein n=1 Tax=Maribellus luteus TaxID=2305463 RepID=A0A399T0T3_9BACT|nr:penicillin acylase family protein [Maribellus luteus]RIJ49428.1 penicillin acylase family protein [Maribellus luteus]